MATGPHSFIHSLTQRNLRANGKYGRMERSSYNRGISMTNPKRAVNINLVLLLLWNSSTWLSKRRPPFHQSLGYNHHFRCPGSADTNGGRGPPPTALRMLTWSVAVGRIPPEQPQRGRRAFGSVFIVLFIFLHGCYEFIVLKETHVRNR